MWKSFEMHRKKHRKTHQKISLNPPEFHLTSAPLFHSIPPASKEFRPVEEADGSAWKLTETSEGLDIGKYDVLPIGSMYGIFTYMNGWCLW